MRNVREQCMRDTLRSSIMTMEINGEIIEGEMVDFPASHVSLPEEYIMILQNSWDISSCKGLAQTMTFCGAPNAMVTQKQFLGLLMNIIIIIISQLRMGYSML